MIKPAILLIGTDELLEAKLRSRLARHGFHVSQAPGTGNLAKTYAKSEPDLIIVHSTGREPEDKLKLVESLREANRFTPIILTTRHSSEKRAILALRLGVADYYKFPFSSNELLLSAKRLILAHSNKRPAPLPINDWKTRNNLRLVGESRPMREVKSYMRKVARTDSTVLITGETGTGKDLAAELIHFNSPRRSKPLVSVNCAALPESLVESELFGYARGAFTGAVARTKGKLELAQDGTVFLDEIGDMSPYAQAKILRCVERKEFFPLGGKGTVPMKARVIAATNQDPEELVSEGVFRKDLFYRLNVARVHLPPLRKRKEDIVDLVNHEIKKLNVKFRRRVEGVAEASLNSLYRYHWPGNVRELKNFLEASYINLPEREVRYITVPNSVLRQLQFKSSGPRYERNHILKALMETNWNKSSAAKRLNWSRMTLYRKMEKHTIIKDRNR